MPYNDRMFRRNTAFILMAACILLLFSCGGQGKRAAGSPAELSEPEQGRQEPGLQTEREQPRVQQLSGQPPEREPPL